MPKTSHSFPKQRLKSIPPTIDYKHLRFLNKVETDGRLNSSLFILNVRAVVADLVKIVSRDIIYMCSTATSVAKILKTKSILLFHLNIKTKSASCQHETDKMQIYYYKLFLFTQCSKHHIVAPKHFP